MEIHSPQSYIDRAQKLVAQGQFTDAFRYVQKAIEIDPKFAPGFLEMGKILEQTGHLDDSLTCYEEAIRLDPQLWESRWRMGIIYDRKGLKELSLQTFQTVMAKVPHLFPPEEHLKLAQAFLQQNNPQGAIEASYFCGDLVTGLQVRAQAQIILEAIDQAEVTLTHIQTIDPGFNLAQEYTNLGKLALKYSQTDRGQNLLQIALSMQPDFIESHFYMAIAFTQTGKYREAFLSFQELISINPNYAPAYYEMGILSIKLSKWEEAESFFSAGRVLNPNIYPQVQPLIDLTLQKMGQTTRE